MNLDERPGMTEDELLLIEATMLLLCETIY